MDWEQIGKEALAIILPVIIAAAAHYLRRLLIAKIGREQFYAAQEWASRAVKAAEQTIKDNPEKFMYAVNLVAAAAKRRGITLPHDEITALIEATVHEHKRFGGFGVPGDIGNGE